MSPCIPVMAGVDVDEEFELTDDPPPPPQLIKIKLIIDKLFLRNLFTKYLLLKFAPNQLGEVLPKVKFLPFFLIATSHL